MRGERPIDEFEKEPNIRRRQLTVHIPSSVVLSYAGLASADGKEICIFIVVVLPSPFRRVLYGHGDLSKWLNALRLSAKIEGVDLEAARTGNPVPMARTRISIFQETTPNRHNQLINPQSDRLLLRSQRRKKTAYVSVIFSKDGLQSLPTDACGEIRKLAAEGTGYLNSPIVGWVPQFLVFVQRGSLGIAELSNSNLERVQLAAVLYQTIDGALLVAVEILVLIQQKEEGCRRELRGAR